MRAKSSSIIFVKNAEKDSNLLHLSDSYTILGNYLVVEINNIDRIGLTSLLTSNQNDFDDLFDAESYLQLAVRWAQTPQQLLNSMTNLGMNDR